MRHSSPTKHQRQIQHYIGVSLAIIMLLASMAFLLHKTLNDINETKDTIQNLQQSADAILYYDEVLTMSARMGAATGNLTWERRYDEAVISLDEALDIAHQLYPHIKDAIDKTSEANNRLIDYERRAFELVSKGEGDEALSLLLGAEYHRDKAIYSNGLMELREGIQTYNRDSNRRLARQTTLSIVVITILFLVFIAVIVYTFRQLHHRQEFERVVADISSRFIGSTKDIFEETILWSMERIASMVNADHSYLFTINKETQSVNNRFEWCNEGIEPVCESVANRSIDDITWWVGKLESTHAIQIVDIHNLTESSGIERHLFDKYNIQSQLIVPIIYADKIVGYMGFSSRVKKDKWSSTDIRLIRAVAEIISRALHESEIERVIVQHERELASILENLPSMVFVKDAKELRFKSFNKAGEELLGIPRDQMIGKNDYDFFPREQADFFTSKDREVLSNREVKDIPEEPIKTPSGTRILHTRKVCIQDEHGEPALLLGISEDITERKQSEQELERIRNYLDSVVNSMPSLLAGIDRSGRVTHWNNQAEVLSGISADIAIKQRLDEILPAVKSHMEIIDQALEQDQELTLHRVTVELPDGRRIWNLILYPLLGEETTGAVLRADDVTEQARMEDMMLQTEKMLSVGGLAAGMAHELNNPLGGILQGLQNIQRRLSNSLDKNVEVAQELGVELAIINTYLERRGITDIFQNMVHAGEHAADIVRNMLQFARKADAELQPEQLDTLIDRALELASVDYDLKKKYDFRQIEIIRDYDPAITQVMCIASEIQQVLLNLFRNAAQALNIEKPEHDRAPRITVRTMLQNEMACIEVEDNGPGMDEETLSHVFEPFFTTRPVGEGTGLGLSVSYFIITEEHKGRMTVDSQPGQGTTFTFCLPK